MLNILKVCDDNSANTVMIFGKLCDRACAVVHSKLYLITLKLKTMLRWTVIFLVVAIIAAIFGFTGIAAGAAAIAKILFYIFIVLFLISLIAGGFRRVD
jgi:uncharacterized membrane protein YtjA (UPF0391 family)